MKEQSLLSSLLLLALLASCNMNGHQLFADGDDDGIATINTSWSQVSKGVIIAGGTDKQAFDFDKEYSTKMDEENAEAFSAAYASQRAQGKSEDDSIAFAKDEERDPKSIFYYIALIAHPHHTALRLSRLYEAKRAEGKSEIWAGAYAKKVVLENKAHEEAEAYAGELENSLTVMEGLSTRANPGDLKDQGRKAEMYRLVLRSDQPSNMAKTFADIYEAQRQNGKSHEWADAYAYSIIAKQSPAEAAAHADNFTEKLLEGKSHEWASVYNAQQIMGQPPTVARAYADAFERQIKSSNICLDNIEHYNIFIAAFNLALVLGYQPDVAFHYSQVGLEQLKKARYSNKWIMAYARKLVLEGKTDGEARAYAEKYQHIPARGFNKASADTCEAQLRAGKSKKQASAYTLAYQVIFQGQDPDPQSAKTYTNTREAQLRAGKSGEWASAYALMIAAGQPEDYAKTFAALYEVQRQENKTHDWASAYALCIANKKSKAYAKTYADAYAAQRQTGKPEEWAQVYAFNIAAGKSHQEAKAYANAQRPND